MTRGWCLIETFFGAVLPISPERHRQLQGVLGDALAQMHRPHFLFGSKELEMGREPLKLPPLENEYLTWHPPEEGGTSDPATIMARAKRVRQLGERVRPADAAPKALRSRSASPRQHAWRGPRACAQRCRPASIPTSVSPIQARRWLKKKRQRELRKGAMGSGDPRAVFCHGRHILAEAESLAGVHVPPRILARARAASRTTPAASTPRRQ